MSSPSRTVTSLGTSVNVARGGRRERRDQPWGGGLGQPQARRWLGSQASCSPPCSSTRGPGAGEVRSGRCWAAAETGDRGRTLRFALRGAAGAAGASFPRPPHCRSWPGARQLPRPARRLSAAGAPARLRTRRARAPPLRRPCAALFPLRLRDPAARRNVAPAEPSPSPPLAATEAGWLRRPRQGPPRPRGGEVPALTVGHAQQQGGQQQRRRQASEGAEPVPLFHLPRGARRRAPGRGQAAVAAAWARIPLALGLGRPRACHGPARRALPRPPAAANQPSSLAGLPGAAPAGGAARGVQNARSRLEAAGDRSAPPSTPPAAGRWGTAVQSLPGAPGRGWAAPGPIPGQGSARLGAASFRLSVAWFGS